MDPDLCLSGTYYEGWVGDTDEVIQLHSQETVRTFLWSTETYQGIWMYCRGKAVSNWGHCGWERKGITSTYYSKSWYHL